MRTYIIGSDGIALCRKVPATVSEGEIVVASKEELQAAPLSGKRLLALWNALPGVEKRRKIGDREALIDRPALQRLLADVAAGRVDTIVVYKIDRLTRSLADFAKIVEILDARGASFVSVSYTHLTLPTILLV